MNHTAAVNGALDRFLDARAGARKFHRAAVGDVDPSRCWADWLARVRDRDAAGLEKVYGSTVVKAALSATQGGPTGGYLVPEDLRDELMLGVTEAAVFRPRATVVPMGSASTKLYLPDATTAPAAAGVPPFWGGLNFSWQPEASKRLETEPQLREVELRAWDLTGYALVSNPLAADGQGLDAWLRQVFARSLAWAEDYAFVNGDGGGQPVGVLNAGCALPVTRGTGGHYSAADGQKMLSNFFGPAGGVWLFSVTALGDLASQTGWIPNGPLQLHGLPVAPTLKQPALGTKGDVILTDPSLYVIGDRGAVDVAFSRDEPGAFVKGQSVWRIVERVDGQPWLNAAVTVPDGGSNKVSPVVVLN